MEMMVTMGSRDVKTFGHRRLESGHFKPMGLSLILLEKYLWIQLINSFMQ